MSEHLHHKLESLQERLLHGKLPRSLRWDEAAALIGHLGQVQPRGGDEFAFIVGEQQELFKRPGNHELGVEEVSRLRRLLKAVGSQAPAAGSTQLNRIVVVIDHHAAHIFRTTGGGATQEIATAKPYDPYNFHHHLIHRKESHYQGERVPEDTSFYKEIANAAGTSGEIVLVGHGTGKSNAAVFLAEYLKNHFPDVFRRVRTVENADLSALSEPEIEALAKRHIDGAIRG